MSNKICFISLSAKSCPSIIPNGKLSSVCFATVGTSCGYVCNSGFRSKAEIDTIACQTSTNWSVDPHLLCSSEYIHLSVKLVDTKCDFGKKSITLIIKMILDLLKHGILSFLWAKFLIKIRKARDK